MFIEEREFTWEPRFGMTEGDADLRRPPLYVLLTSDTHRKSHTQCDSMPKPLNSPWISQLLSFPSRRNAEFMPVFKPLKTLVKNRGKSSRLISFPAVDLLLPPIRPANWSRVIWFTYRYLTMWIDPFRNCRFGWKSMLSLEVAVYELGSDSRFPHILLMMIVSFF